MKLLRGRARRLYGGKLFAALTEGVWHLREEEGREAVIAWLGDAATMTKAEREAIRAEQRPALPARRRGSA